MDELVEFIARNLVTEPDAVRVNRVQRNHLSIYKLYVHPSDMGRDDRSTGARGAGLSGP